MTVLNTWQSGVAGMGAQSIFPATWTKSARWAKRERCRSNSMIARPPRELEAASPIRLKDRQVVPIYG